MPSRARGSSSTTSARIGCGLSMGGLPGGRWPRARDTVVAAVARAVADRHRDGDEDATLRVRRDGQAVIFGIELLQPRARVAQPHALGPSRVPARLEPPAVVAYRHHESLIPALRADLHSPSRGPRSDAMSDRVLDDGLQKQVGHLGLEHLRRDVLAHRQAISKADLLDVEVPIDEVELLPERHHLTAGLIE